METTRIWGGLLASSSEMASSNSGRCFRCRIVLFAFTSALAACRGKQRDFSGHEPLQNVEYESDSGSGASRTESTPAAPSPDAPGGVERGEGAPPVVVGVEPADSMNVQASGSCDRDAGSCLPVGDASRTSSVSICIPTGPRDCSSDLDSDCDGQPDSVADDVCVCSPGSVEPCEEHPGLDGRGQCQAGSRTCMIGEGNLSSNWGACEGSVRPGERDSCSVAGDDTDCDGTDNGGCPCVDGQTQPCGPNTENGLCQLGVQTCVNARFGECEGAVFPAARNCSSQHDNDCDGRPDNTIDNVCTCAIGSVQACGTHPGRDGNGQCRAGSQRCEARASSTTSTFGSCAGSLGPGAQDSCAEGNDGNCNGIPNESCACINGDTRACGDTDLGVCQLGTQTCVDGRFGGCQGAVGRGGRNCSSQQDNDCDGRPDNTIDNVCECIPGQGNGPCSSDANNSRCTNQGLCAPCQVNADCLFISGGRTFCDAGRCSTPPVCGDGIRSGGEVCDGGTARPTAVGSCNPECTGFYEERSILLTREAYLTNLGGVAGADAKCVAEFGTGYKALIVGGGRRATVTPFLGDAQQDWVLHKYTHYLNSDGALIWRTDTVALLAASGGRRQQLFADLWTSTTFSYPLAGFNDDWTTLPDSPTSQVGTCNGWSTNDSAGFTRWAGIQVQRLGDVSRGTGEPCGGGGSLLCVEQ